MQGWLPFLQRRYLLQRVHATPTPCHGGIQRFQGPQPAGKRLKPTPYQTTSLGSGDIFKTFSCQVSCGSKFSIIQYSTGITTPEEILAVRKVIGGPQQSCLESSWPYPHLTGRAPWPGLGRWCWRGRWEGCVHTHPRTLVSFPRYFSTGQRGGYT